jgi:hypothetical protein
MTTATTIEIATRAKAFSTEGVRRHTFLVDLSDSSVLVWDCAGNHYTNCNCLTDSAKRRILKLAKELAR